MRLGPPGPYSSAIVASGSAFLAGQGPLLPDGSIVRGTIEEQTRLTLSNLDVMAKECGSSLARAVKVTVYLSEIGDWAAMNTEYVRWFGDVPPVRTVVSCSLNGFDIEIDVIPRDVRREARMLDLSGPVDSHVWHLGAPFFKPEIFRLGGQAGQEVAFRSEGIRMPMLTVTYLETSAHLIPDGECITDLDVDRFMLVPTVCVQVPKRAREPMDAHELDVALRGLGVGALSGSALVVSTGWWRR